MPAIYIDNNVNTYQSISHNRKHIPIQRRDINKIKIHMNKQQNPIAE